MRAELTSGDGSNFIPGQKTSDSKSDSCCGSLLDGSVLMSWVAVWPLWWKRPRNALRDD